MGGCARQADGTAGLPPSFGNARAIRHLRFVPTGDIEMRGIAAHRLTT